MTSPLQGGVTPQQHNPLLGKKICGTGDSICYGQGYLGGYIKLISDRNAMTYQNLGVGGATLATVSGRTCICDTAKNLDMNGDYYLFEGGFNDSQNNVYPNNAGYPYRMYSTQPATYTDILNAMNFLCYELVVNHVGKKIGFLFPHKIDNADWTVAPNNTYSFTWKNYRDFMKDILKTWGVPYLDLAELGGLDTYFSALASTYMDAGDKVHPNKLGYETFYVPKIEAWLKTL